MSDDGIQSIHIYLALQIPQRYKQKLNILNFVNDYKYKLKNFSEIFKRIIKAKVHLFTIDGKYLMQNGMKEGSALGKVLKIIEKEWILNSFKISKERIKEIIKSN